MSLLTTSDVSLGRRAEEVLARFDDHDSLFFEGHLSLRVSPLRTIIKNNSVSISEESSCC